MHYLTAAVRYLLKLAIIIAAFFALTVGGLLLVVRILPDLHPIGWFVVLIPWFWLVNRFVLSPLQFKFGIKFKQYDPWYENRVATRTPQDEQPPRREGETFFACVRNGRHPVYVVMAIIFGGSGAAMLVAVIIAAVRRPIEVNENTLLGLVVSVVWITGMLGIAAVICWHLIRKREISFRIDRRGITISDKHWPWSAIRWIGIRSAGSFGDGVYFQFGPRGLSPDRWLPSYPPVPKAEAIEALEDIAAYLEEEFPDVIVD